MFWDEDALAHRAAVARPRDGGRSLCRAAMAWAAPPSSRWSKAIGCRRSGSARRRSRGSPMRSATLPALRAVRRDASAEPRCRRRRRRSTGVGEPRRLCAVHRAHRALRAREPGARYSAFMGTVRAGSAAAIPKRWCASRRRSASGMRRAPAAAPQRAADKLDADFRSIRMPTRLSEFARPRGVSAADRAFAPELQRRSQTRVLERAGNTDAGAGAAW